MKREKHKVPFKLRLYRFKNTGLLSVLDRLIYKFSPPEKYNGVPKKILFNRSDKMGDALVTLPVLRDLKLNYPELKIDVLCSRINKFVFEGLDYINHIHVYEPAKAKETETELIAEKYDAAIDLVGTDKKLIRMLKRCSPFVAGSRLFWFSWLYDYYLKTNWVSEYDYEPMTLKIEGLLKDCFGFNFSIRNSNLPFNEYSDKQSVQKFDVLFHIGTGEVRKLMKPAEERLLELLKDRKVLITDGSETERFRDYREKFAAIKNFTFRLYEKIQDIVPDARNSGLVLCYDGGQAHFLGQYTKCITLVGSLSLKQWAPYDFSNYSKFKKWDNGVEAYVSDGVQKHIAVNFPIWCLPCFDIGCNTRPCINSITPEQIIELINSNVGN